MNHRFLALESSFDESYFIIIPAGIGGTSVGNKGAEKSPEAIIKASFHLEDIDTELKFNFTEAGIYTFSSCSDIKSLQSAVLRVISEGKFPIIIGGEHFITYAVLQVMKEIFGEISAIFFDAHADMFQEFDGNPFSHACALHLSLPYLKDFISIGVRNVAPAEMEEIKRRGLTRNFLFFEDVLDENRLNLEVIKRRLKEIKDKSRYIYISFDFDFVDPAFLPSLSTPEPLGFSLRETFSILKETIFELSELIKGIDFVEFCPQGFLYADITASKIIAKSIAYISFANNISGICRKSL